jgi:hypothetical protein
MYKDCKPVSLKVLHNMNGDWSKALSTGPCPVVDPDVFLYLNLMCIRPLTEKPNLLWQGTREDTSEQSKVSFLSSSIVLQ